METSKVKRDREGEEGMKGRRRSKGDGGGSWKVEERKEGKGPGGFASLIEKGISFGSVFETFETVPGTTLLVIIIMSTNYSRQGIMASRVH